MEKYGVDESPEKTASEGQRCPKCKSLLEDKDDVGIYKCPKCGTEPFEDK